MAHVEGIGHGQIGIDGDLNGVGGSGLSQILDGEDVMIGGETQGAVGLLLVDIQLGLLGALDLDLTLQIRGIVDVERKHAHRTAIAQGREHSTLEGPGNRSGKGYGLQERLVVELLALHVDGIGGSGHHDGMGA